MLDEFGNLQRENKLIPDNAVSLDYNNYPEGQNPAIQQSNAEANPGALAGQSQQEKSKAETERFNKQTQIEEAVRQ